MKTRARAWAIVGGAVLALLLWGGGKVGQLAAKEKGMQVEPNDLTYRLFNLLDSKYNGKLDDFCILAGVSEDSKNAGQSHQYVLRVEYNKDRGFGKLRIYVREVAPLTPAQLKAYTPKQIYDFAEADIAKFTKTDAGPFGKPGDVYFEPAEGRGALATVTITPEVEAQYDHYVSDYILPALEKKSTEGNPS